MSASETHQNHVPAALGGDLPQAEQLAVAEGHDADMPTSTRVEQPQEKGEVASKEGVLDTEGKVDRVSSASSSAHEVETDKDVEKGMAEATAEEADAPRDSNIVDWEGPDDPQNPYNWPAKKKWANIGILSLLTLLVPLASSMFAPGVPDVMRNFNNNKYATPRYQLLLKSTANTTTPANPWRPSSSPSTSSALPSDPSSSPP